jgi:hypothetical protein
MQTKTLKALKGQKTRQSRSSPLCPLCFVLGTWSFIVLCLAVTGCVAPIARTSQVGSGFGFEGGGGLSYYNGGALEKDATSWWGYRAVGTRNVGPFVSGRLGYGLKNRFGGDLSLALGYGPTVVSGGDAGAWVQATLAGKYRPWQSNNMLFAELGFPKFGVGWVGGLPQKGRERWSFLLETGVTLTDDVLELNVSEILNQVVPPNMVMLNVAHNIYAGRRGLRISPNAGVHVALDWSPIKVGVNNVLFGVTVAP